MPTLLINFIFLFGFAAIGLAAGWWLRGNIIRRSSKKEELSKQSQVADLEDRRQQTEAVIHHVQELTQNIAYDVEEHSESVQEANHVLQASEGDDSENLLATMAKIVHANERLQTQLDAAEEKLHVQSALLASHAEDARTDSLTSIANRRAFDSELAEAENAFRFDGQNSCVMMIDVDHFKKFNDTHGHQAGDEILRHVAKTLRRKVKRDGLVARYGGEEFAVIFRNLTLDQCLSKAEVARGSIAQLYVDFAGKNLQVTASAGLAALLPGEPSVELVKRADDALYQAKREGRDRGYYHDGERCLPLIENANIDPSIDSESLDTSSEEAVEQSVSELVTSTQMASMQAEIESPSSTDRPTRPEIQPVAPEVQPVPPEAISEPSEQLDEAIAEQDEAVCTLGDWKSDVSGRVEFSEDLTRRLAEWKRGGRGLSILMIRIDSLTRLVEDRGDVGLDAVLKTTAQFLKASMRDMDHVARFEDGTFALMLPSSSALDAEAVAQRLRVAISRCQVPTPEGIIRFTVSIGICDLTTGDTVGSVLARAQSSLNTAISQGGNTCHVEYHQPV